jgi:hypothetical protein
LARTSDSRPRAPQNESGTGAAPDRGGRQGARWWGRASSRGDRPDGREAVESGTSTLPVAASAAQEESPSHDPSLNDAMMQHIELTGTLQEYPPFSFWGSPSSTSTVLQGIFLVCSAAVVCGVSAIVYWAARSRGRLDDLHAAAGAVSAFLVLVLVASSLVWMMRARQRRRGDRASLREWTAEHNSPPRASSTSGDR